MSTKEVTVSGPKSMDSAPGPDLDSEMSILDVQDTEMTSVLTLKDEQKIQVPLTPKSPAMSYQNSIGGYMEHDSTYGSGQTYSPPNYPTPFYGVNGSGDPTSYGNIQLSPSRGRPNAGMTPALGGVPLSAISPGPVYASKDQLDVAYAYAIEREDGTITRLLPADELADINGIERSQGPEGLIILQAPRQLSPRRRQGSEALIPCDVVERLPVTGSYYASLTPLEAQAQIDAIVASTHRRNLGPFLRRREKIYCDKWIHDGTCAFTQMGCKYKHVMPHDAETLASLGLHNGLPSWYRKAYGIQMNSNGAYMQNQGQQAVTRGNQSVVSPASQGGRNRNNHLSTAWRALASPVAATGGSGRGNGKGVKNVNRSRANSGAPGTKNGYGPIAPPPGLTRKNSNGINSGNDSYAVIGPAVAIKGDESEEDGEVLNQEWRGRGRQSGFHN